MNPTLLFCALAACLYSGAALAQTAEVNLYAAGSLRAVLTEVAKDFTAKTGQPVAGTFGPSGLLRERIEKGEAAQVFASANTSHPEQLAKAGGWAEPVVFTRNNLCALTLPEVNAEGRADIFLTYCTNAVAAQNELPKLRIVEMPADLSVGATYGMTVRDGVPEAATALAEYIRSPEAQQVFKRHGFGAI